MRWLLLLLVVTGCSTPVKHQSIMPPLPSKRAKVAEVPMSPARTTFTLRWEDCAPQPTGVWYRVYEIVGDFKTRRLYAELTNAYELAIPMTNVSGFFTLEATDGTKSMWIMNNCQ